MLICHPPPRPFVPPQVVAHADWGSVPRKRWMCVAPRTVDGNYRVSAPEQLGELPTLLPRLCERAGGGSVLMGFDFPIGLPAAYAKRAGIERFKDVLPEFGNGRWSRFYRVAESAEEISLERPFYPMHTTGGKRRSHLVQALGVGSFPDLLRECERENDTRGAASPLFWTLGGKQVGKAALIGWEHVLAPALRDPDLDVRLWPFDGGLQELIAPGRIVITETYPAEACLHLGMTPPGSGWSKTSQDGRLAQREAMMDWVSERPVELERDLTALIAEGFGPSRHAEDPFDALIGLLSMLEVVLGHRAEGSPDRDEVRRVEGWILGQQAATCP
jgi:hypothetical protein